MPGNVLDALHYITYITPNLNFQPLTELVL